MDIEQEKNNKMGLSQIELRMQRDEVLRLAEEAETYAKLKKAEALYGNYFSQKQTTKKTSLLFNHYLFWFIFLVGLEVFIIFSGVIEFFSTSVAIQPVLNEMKPLFLGLGQLEAHGHFKDPASLKLYHAISLILLAPKVVLIALWLNSDRSGMYQTLVVSPLTYTKGLSTQDFVLEPMRTPEQNSPKPIYRSMFSRIFWSSLTLMIGFLCLWSQIYARDDEVNLIFMIMISLYAGLCICILKDYFIYFKILLRRLVN